MGEGAMATLELSVAHGYCEKQWLISAENRISPIERLTEGRSTVEGQESEAHGWRVRLNVVVIAFLPPA